MPVDAGAASSPSVPELQRRVDELAAELRQRTRDHQESLEYQAATSEVIQLISRTNFDLASVLQTVADTALRLCEAEMCFVVRREGDAYRVVTAAGATSELLKDARTYQQRQEAHLLVPGRGTLTGRVALAKQAVQIADLAADPEYTLTEATTVGKIRTQLGVPLLREGTLIGVIMLSRQRVEPFVEPQIKLAQTFADQAVIAIENTRLLTGQREALERQTATSEVLQVINASPGRLEPVFDAMLEKAVRLCAADAGVLATFDGSHFHVVATLGFEGMAEFPRGPLAPHPDTGIGRVAAGERTVHILDSAAGEAFTSGDRGRRALVELGGARSQLCVALHKEGRVLGAFTIWRREVRAFDEHQIALLESFAAQAVIAMENARLLTEQREALERQTATAEVLQVINSSPGNLAPVFDTILEKAHNLCDAPCGSLQLYDGSMFRAVADRGLPETLATLLRQGVVAQQFREPDRDPVQVDMVEAYAASPDDPVLRAVVKDAGLRTVLFVPLHKEGIYLGRIVASRRDVRPFTDKQVTLLQNFAAQAVIAMDNARLLTEQREALEQQTATAEVLQVINSSPGNLTPVFEAMLEKAMRLCEASFGGLTSYDGERFHTLALRGLGPEVADAFREPWKAGPGSYHENLLMGERLVHADFAANDAARRAQPQSRALAEIGGARSGLLIALRKDDTLLGSLWFYRKEVRPFSDKQIALLQNFAAQAVIAIENARLLSEQREALERQTATAEVLEVINSSPGDLAPVFEAMLEKATLLCEADAGVFALRGDDGRFAWASVRGFEGMPEFSREPVVPHVEPGVGRVIRGENVVHILDSAAGHAYESGDRGRRAIVDLGGARTQLCAALRKDGSLLGAFVIWRREVRAFSDRQISLLQSFAAQAVIAMENARLMNEQREALEQQTATAEVLQVINSSPGNLEPVFAAILEKAMHVCSASFGGLWKFEADRYVIVALHGVPKAYAEFLRATTVVPGPGSAPYRFLHGERSVIQNVDLAAEEPYRAGDPQRRALVDVGGARSALQVPLCKDDTVIGVVTIYRQEVQAFSERQIALLQNFAAQAVIAMENARLLTETREALEQQTATAEVLEVINSSPGNLGPVFDTLLEKAMQLCGAAFGQLDTHDGKAFHTAAVRGVPVRFAEYRNRHPSKYGPGTGPARMLAGERVLYHVDLKDEEIYRNGEPNRRALVDLGGARSAIQVALRKDESFLGFINLFRQEVRPFTDKQVALLQNFAAQAVIAMENARLLSEQREALERQTATAQVLQVINESPGDLEPVFEAMLERAVDLGGAAFGIMNVYEEGEFRAVALRGVPDGLIQQWAEAPRPTARNALSRMVNGEDVVHIDDLAAYETYQAGDLRTHALVQVGGARSLLAVALRKEGELLGTITVYRQEVRPFSDRQISLLQNFASQGVIAIDNARLLEEIRQRQSELRVTFDNMGDGVAMFDADLRLTSWNRNLQEIMDLPADRLAERPRYSEYLHMLAAQGEFGTKDVEAELASRLENTDRELRLERTRPDGTVIEVRRNAVPDGGFVLIYSDITQRRRTEAAIRAARDAAEAALERQTATADILKVIASSPTDVQPVLEAVARAAVQFCGATDANIHMRDGDEVLSAAHHGPLGAGPGVRRPLNRETGFGTAILDGRTTHVADVKDLDAVQFATTRRLAAQFGFRAFLAAPLLREGTAIGSLSLRRGAPGPFTPQQVELLETFAAQAVIAIENVRLFTELKESLEQQTATAEILRVISQSPTDVGPVLSAVARAAMKFCGANDALVVLRDGEEWFIAAHEGPIETMMIGTRSMLTRYTAPGRAMTDGKIVQIKDLQSDEGDEFPEGREIGARTGFRSALAAPLLRDDVSVGAISLRRREAGEFEPRQVELLKTFAAQAVIAIQNVRLFTELRESLEQQTATAEVLRVISQSPTDVQPVLDVVVNAARRFCGAADALIVLREDDDSVIAAHEGSISAALGLRRRIRRTSIAGRAIIDADIVHVGDITMTEGGEFAEALAFAREFNWRAALAVPMMREGVAVGGVLLRKPEPGDFTARQIALLKTFAAQAVIAIENVRLFTELKESLEQQTATSEILRAISQSPTDVQPVLDAVAAAAVRFCGAEDAAITLREGDEAVIVAHTGPLSVNRRRLQLDKSYVRGRVILEGRIVHVPDLLATDDYPAGRQQAQEFGHRAVASAPLLREGEAIGCLTLQKPEPTPYTDRQIQLLEAFAAQAVIAIENVRLFTELRDSLERLKAAQANLIQSEKMASLGQLTAGIAHEIKNPLNFVNNFAGLSVELLNELKEIAVPVLAGMSEDARVEFGETIEMITSNLDKIADHGRRADGIVKSMLSHSRGGTGDWQESNINGLVEEALNLAYHGARAQDKDFNVTLERDFGIGAKLIEVVPQDVMRVFLNLIGNGFYATRKRHLGGTNAGYRPTLRVSTRDFGEAVEIRVRDNGTGIPLDVRAKLFQPFFTTKPTGEGTGLGLSISYDIVTQQHGGTIEVDSEPGSFTEFTVRLPRSRRTA